MPQLTRKIVDGLLYGYGFLAAIEFRDAALTPISAFAHSIYDYIRRLVEGRKT
jgi:hypothetical protein